MRISYISINCWSPSYNTCIFDILHNQAQTHIVAIIVQLLAGSDPCKQGVDALTCHSHLLASLFSGRLTGGGSWWIKWQWQTQVFSSVYVAWACPSLVWVLEVIKVFAWLRLSLNPPLWTDGEIHLMLVQSLWVELIKVQYIELVLINMKYWCIPMSTL